MKTSTKIFILSGFIYAAAFGVYLLARKIYNNDLERLKASIFWGSTLDIGPYTNWAHYLSFSVFVIAFAITVAGVLLWKSEKMTSPLVANGDKH